jgi:hydrogenase maturation protein HypF
VTTRVEGRRIRVRGQVQGVGMRPFVARIARREGLVGEVINDARGVRIEVGGPPDAIARFEAALVAEAPALARIDAVERAASPPPEGETFVIARSAEAGPARAGVTVDAATCPACQAELFDPEDRRHRYPLINCTECGPRFSLITGVPYDRSKTTMAPFPMCAACQAEYEDPGDRRYHAQPACCPACGPHLRAAPPHEMARAPSPEGSEPALARLVDVLADGKVAAVQGLGGFHLAGLADAAETVRQLRAAKRRDAKPFAVMVRDLEQAERWVRLSPAGRAALTSVERPIVLAEARPSPLAEGVAPGTHRVGVMLPYTPIHHLLFADPRLASRPIVMTSANIADAPMLHRAEELARAFAGAPVDLVAWHDRAIARRVDDSIVLDPGPADDEDAPERAPASTRSVSAAGSLPARRPDAPSPADVPSSARPLRGAPRPTAGAPSLLEARPSLVPAAERSASRAGTAPKMRPPQTRPDVQSIRRARGFVPAPLPLGPSPDGLAVGGDLKNTFCLVRDGEALLSAHHGDLAHRSARAAFEAEIDQWLAFFDVEPAWIACDLHPDFASTRAAERLARARGVPLLRVQHHHAHAASLLAEAGRDGPALAIVLDGFGYGADGSTWGGELLLAAREGFRRLACLAPVAAVGGDAYARDPRRPALAHLAAALGPGAADHPAAARLVADAARRRQLVALGSARGRPSHSAGRLFDAASALLGVSERNRFEAESAMALESAARRGQPDARAPAFALRDGPEGVTLLDPAPLVRWLAEPPSTTEDAALTFHHRLAEAFAEATVHALAEGAPRAVVVSGGVAVNQTFSMHLRQRLEAEGAEVLEHRRVPANDGGLALGQAAVAARNVG